MMRGLFYETIEHGQIECTLCAHYCRLRPGQTGLCQVRHNVDGTLVTSSYGRPVIMAVEPIEKKYLFHVFPGCQTLSLGTPGCNLGCKYCINWRVSQRGVSGAEPEISPQEVVDRAVALNVDCIAFTYTEPTIFIEYAVEIAQLARAAGLAVVAKSNGYMTPAALAYLAPWLDAINIDLKGWHSEQHHKVVGGALQPVLENLKLAVRLGIWLEVTTLIVPGLSDDAADLDHMAQFIASELGQDTPWHLLRFYPNYQMRDRPATSQDQLQLAVESGQRAGLHYMYTKELSRGEMLNTICPRCQIVAIERVSYRLVSNNLQKGHCAECGQAIVGVGLHRQSTESLVSTEVEAT
jgi:pyruvate formate lyase activating enzyme